MLISLPTDTTSNVRGYWECPSVELPNHSKIAYAAKAHQHDNHMQNCQQKDTYPQQPRPEFQSHAQNHALERNLDKGKEHERGSQRMWTLE
jgi:hypothetical protein